MERRYKAFISYRHLPIDLETAKKLHRRIERYVIPKELRKDGQKKLGLVFRDQDELPIASDLSANIREALDASEFLIVICTPETAKSRWVLQEIDYFLAHHDRDHLLAVLADGLPEEAFPPALREIRSESGELLENVEPLAANIVADSRAKRDRLFRTESLRILAALIGCPFDALYRREQRYRRRRAAAALSAAALIALAFIGMLLNRNAEIRAQLRQAQINESKALAALSEQAYGEGDFTGALRLALRALPGTGGERPYTAEAERALSAALDPYKRGQLGYFQSVEQSSRILGCALSEDGECFVTADAAGVLRVYETASGRLRWSREAGTLSGILLPEGADALLAVGPEGTSLYALTDGELRWKREELVGINFGGLSPAGHLLLSACYSETDPARSETLSVVAADSGEPLQSIVLGPGPGRFCAAGGFSEDESLAAALLWRPGEERASLCLLDLAAASARVLAEDLPYSPGSADYRILFTQEKDLILACDSMDGASAVRLYVRADDYACRYTRPIETEQVAQVDNGEVMLFASLDLLACERGRIAVGSKHILSMLDEESGELLWTKTLPGRLLAARMYANACLGLALSDGTLSFCTDEGSLSYTQDVYCFDGGYPLYGAALCGGSYPESVFAVIPDAYRQRAAFVRFLEEPAMIPIAARDPEAKRTILIASPGGKRVACLAYDYASRALSGRLLDLEEGVTGESFFLPEPAIWANPGAIALTDGGLFLLGGRVFDPESGSFSERGETGELPAEITADALPPGTELPPECSRLLSARDGKLLLAFSGTGELRVFDAESGALLHSASYSAYRLEFRAASAHYDVRELPEEGRLLIFYDDLNRDEAVCIALDLSLWECVGVYEGAAACLTAADRMLVCHNLDDIWLSPRWSLEEMTEKAEGILGSGA